MTASKNGVSEPEIEDFISLDDKVGDIEGLRLFSQKDPSCLIDCRDGKHKSSQGIKTYQTSQNRTTKSSFKY